MTHTIHIYDNFDFYDGCDHAGDYPDAEAAVAAAKSIIDRSLDHERGQAKDPDNPEEVFQRWDDFGDYPSITPAPEPPFDACAYAGGKAAAMCSEPPAPTL